MLSWDATSYFSALGNETRFAIVSALVRAGTAGLCLSRLARRVGTSRTSLSRYVARLVEVGLITRSREGQMVVCRIDRDALEEFVAFISRRLGPKSGAPERRARARRSRAHRSHAHRSRTSASLTETRLSLAARLEALVPAQTGEIFIAKQSAPAPAAPRTLPCPGIAATVLPRNVIPKEPEGHSYTHQLAQRISGLGKAHRSKADTYGIIRLGRHLAVAAPIEERPRRSLAETLEKTARRRSNGAK